MTQFRDLPSVDAVLSNSRVQHLVDEYSRDAVLALVREQIDDARNSVRSGGVAPQLDDLIDALEARVAESWRLWPRPVINATGVVLHTNLGRAPLSDDSVAAMESAAKAYSELELDLETGKRGSRQAYLGRLVCELTGAEAAFVVNNNASAVLLGLAAVAAGKEVIVSRGEAVEIGGGFRIPDVLRQSGADLVEVGTTNRTYVQDYERALSKRTGAILSVHSSNFKVSGFTHSPSLAELVKLGSDHAVPVLHDLGSGCLLDTSAYGLAHEPMPQESIAAGASLAFFSGDKLLGGPQAGIVAGYKDLIGTVSRHPLARALRCDKLSMAGLVATLLHYIKGEAQEKVPIWRTVGEPHDSLNEKATRWSRHLGRGTSVAEGLSTIGGGSLPGETLPTSLLVLEPGADGGAEALAARLRRGEPPVVGRIDDNRVLLDPRTVLSEQEEDLLKVVSDALGDD